MEVHKGNEELRLTNSDVFCLLTSAAKDSVPKISHLSQVFSGKSKIEKITKLIITCKHHSQCLEILPFLWLIMRLIIMISVSFNDDDDDDNIDD